MQSIALCQSEDNTHKEKEDFINLIEEVNALYAEISCGESLSLDDVEVRVFEAFRSFAQKFLEMCVSRKASEKASEPVECPTCKEPCRPLRKRVRNFTTLCGKISINRWVYFCKQGHRHVPWEAKQKLLDHYTHRVAEAMCRLSARRL